jgi:hypothetical protein
MDSRTQERDERFEANVQEIISRVASEEQDESIEAIQDIFSRFALTDNHTDLISSEHPVKRLRKFRELNGTHTKHGTTLPEDSKVLPSSFERSISSVDFPPLGTTHKPLNQFTLFPNLPSEIRDQIWGHYASDGPRIVRMQIPQLRRFSSRVWSNKLLGDISFFDRDVTHPTGYHYNFSSQNIATMSRVCSESRAIAKQSHSNKIFLKKDYPVTFNAQEDTVYLDFGVTSHLGKTRQDLTDFPDLFEMMIDLGVERLAVNRLHGPKTVYHFRRAFSIPSMQTGPEIRIMKAISKLKYLALVRKEHEYEETDQLVLLNGLYDLSNKWEDEQSELGYRQHREHGLQLTEPTVDDWRSHRSNKVFLRPEIGPSGSLTVSKRCHYCCPPSGPVCEVRSLTTRVAWQDYCVRKNAYEERRYQAKDYPRRFDGVGRMETFVAGEWFPTT